MYDDFPRRLKMLRKEKRISQEELALQLEVSRSAVAGWERSQKHPSANTLRKIALFFNVSTDYLCGRTTHRRNITVAPISELDLSKLNAHGLRMLAEFYRLLVQDDKYKAQK